MAKPQCNAVGCPEPRVRPESTHCKVHDVEWRAVQRDQAALLQRRIALGMAVMPRTWRTAIPTR
jgi:hypothetical protein